MYFFIGAETFVTSLAEQKIEDYFRSLFYHILLCIVATHFNFLVITCTL